jgi:hypothetical protein
VNPATSENAVDMLRTVTLIVVALAMVPVLAHALELPGKMRLGKENYFAVQRIYYPGFTIAGFAEVVGLVSTLVLLLMTPKATAAFWLVAVALAGLVISHAVYWMVIHAVNKVWLQGEPLSAAGSSFFSLGSARTDSDAGVPHWKTLRNRWEYAQTVRAASVVASFVALVVAGH